jgi:hypothetical protein
MFHSLFVLICLKVDSVFFKFPCLSRSSDILSLSNKIHRLKQQHPWASRARQINGYSMPTQLLSIQEDPFYGVQAPSFLSFTQTEMY